MGQDFPVACKIFYRTNVLFSLDFPLRFLYDRERTDVTIPEKIVWFHALQTIKPRPKAAGKGIL